ncbi:MAG: hypothetical protein IKM61_06000 [Eubacteriaceae bacterium]|nr:hypothetical protein [Eubacteriaceae bacterium]
MKKIICYGDSNTFGHNAIEFKRYDENTRWCGILKKNMSDKAEIIEMGLNGRTVGTDESLISDRNAAKTIESELQAYNADIIIIMLGTNDCKTDYKYSADDIAGHMDLLLKKVKNISPASRILLVSPVPMTEKCSASSLGFDINSSDVSKQLSEKYQLLAQKHQINFTDAGKWNVELTGDGCHYTADGHKTFAENIIKVISDILQF